MARRIVKGREEKRKEKSKAKGQQTNVQTDGFIDDPCQTGRQARTHKIGRIAVRQAGRPH